MDNTTTTKNKVLTRWRSDPIWILGVVVGLIFFLIYVAYAGYSELLVLIVGPVDVGAPNADLLIAFYVIAQLYTSTILDILLIFLLCWLIKPNRYIWKSFLPRRKNAPVSTETEDVLAVFYGSRRNSVKMLGWGALIGFLMNGFAIVCAVLHGDVSFYYDFRAAQIPLFLFGMASVLIQSSAEELWFRGFLFERLHERCPLWLVALISGILFGAMHLINEGVTVLSVIEIALSGIAFLLLRWYCGSIWMVMGVHAAWNFTQAFVFGLPNSGFPSMISLLHPVSSEGTSNLIYDYSFGVEGALPAVVADVVLIAVVLILAAKKGRLKELTMNRAKAMEVSA